MNSYNRIFSFFAFSFIVFLYAGNVLQATSTLLALLFAGVLLLLNFYIWVGKYFFYIFAIVVGGILASFLLMYYHTQGEAKKELIISYDTTLEYQVELEILSVYKKEDFDIRYIAKLQSIDTIKLEEDIDVLFRTKTNFGLENGDIIRLYSVVEPVKNFRPNFDYVSFLQSKNIYTTMYSHDFENLGSAHTSRYKEFIKNLRTKGLESIHAIYPKNEAVYLGGILIGARENIPEDMSDSFNNSGLTHLIAVSGYNITIIIIFLSYILSYSPKIFRVVCITGCIILYASIVGDSAAVVRASIMGLVGYYVLMSGRQGDSLAIILFTALIMLCFNPLLLNYDISFQLSFLAVFGLLYTQQFFEKIFYFIPKKYALQESFVLTLSAFVFTVPIMLYSFGQISLLAPIANMLVGWTIPFAMLFGVMSLLAYMFSPMLGYIIGYIEYFFLKWTTTVAHYFGNFEFSLLKWDMGENASYFVSLYFIAIIFSILYYKKAA